MDMDLKDRIVRARKARGMTQKALAEAIGLRRGSVAQWENGDSKSLKHDNLVKVCEVLDIRERWLTTGQGPMERQPKLSKGAIDVARAHDMLDTQLQEELRGYASFLISRQLKQRQQSADAGTPLDALLEQLGA